MADLYSQVIVGDGVSTNTVGQNTRKVLTRSDVEGPETTWLVIEAGDYWIGGESFTQAVELVASDSNNYKAIVGCIQTYCEILEVVRASGSAMSIKVRESSIPYTGTERAGDGNSNTVLSALLNNHPELSGNWAVWHTQFRGNGMNYD